MFRIFHSVKTLVMKSRLIIFLSLILAVNTATSASDQHAEHSTIKSGSDIQFGSIQINDAAIGETATIDITVLEQQSTGIMKMDIISHPGLSLKQSPNSFDIDTKNADIHRMRLNVSGAVAGRHYVNVRITQDRIFSPETSVYAIPVQIGPRQIPASSARIENGKIIYDADEDIR